MGLDMYLLEKVYIGAGSLYTPVTGNIELYKRGERINIVLDRVLEIVECVGYWRKFPALHQWFVVNAFNGVSDCREHSIDRKTLQKLLEQCKNIINTAQSNGCWLTMAKTAFPWVKFDLASDFQKADFLENLRETSEILHSISKMNRESSFYYRASW